MATTGVRLLICGFGMLLSGCASQVFVRSAVAYWPFQQLEIQTPTGAVTGYLSRPEAAIPQRLVVVLQTAPCTDEAAGTVTFNTSGILWEQFKNDSAFFQFERPGTRAVAVPASGVPAASDHCMHGANGSITPELWQRTARQAVAALRAGERSASLATVYVGIGAGTVPAARLAAEDRHAAALVMVSGAGLNHRLDRLIVSLRADEHSLQAINTRVNEALAADTVLGPRGRAGLESTSGGLSESLRLAPRLPVLIVHGASDNETPVESVLALFSELTVTRRPLSMLLFAGLGRDFGLSERRYECFEAAMRTLNERMRNLEYALPQLAANLEMVACDSADALPPSEALQMERIGEARS